MNETKIQNVGDAEGKKFKKHRGVFAYAFGALLLFALLKIFPSHIVETIFESIISFLPMILMGIVAIHGYIKYKKHPEKHDTIRKEALVNTFYLLLTTLLFYLLYSPAAFRSVFEALKGASDFFTKDIVFALAVVIGVISLFVSVLFFLIRSVQKKRGTYEGSLEDLRRRTLYTLFFIFFFLFSFSAAAFPGAYAPVTSYLATRVFSPFTDNPGDIAEKTLGSSLAQTYINLKESFTDSNAHLVETLEGTTETFNNALERTTEELRVSLTEDLEEKFDGGTTIEGDLTITDDLKVEDVAYFTDILPLDDNKYSIGSSSKTWERLYVNFLHGGEGAITLGDSASSHDLEDSNDIVVSGDAEVNGTLYLDGALTQTGTGTVTLSGVLLSNGGITTDNIAVTSLDLGTNTILDGELTGSWTFSGGALGIGTTPIYSFLDIAAATSSLASVHIHSGSAPSSPSAGDVYSNGTNLYFFNGTTWDDLTVGSGGGSLGEWTLAGNVIAPNLATTDIAVGGATISSSVFSIDESTGVFLFGGDNSVNPVLRFESSGSDTGDFGFNTNDAFYFSGSRVGFGETAPEAFVDITGASGSTASLRVRSGSAPSSPSSGDIYSDGSDLYFHNGSSWETLNGAGGTTSFLGLTDTPASFTAGSVLFTSGSAVTEDNTNFFWDDTNNRLGIGTTNPNEALHIGGNIRIDGTLEDENGDSGTSGQILSSTGTGTEWIDAPDATPGGLDGAIQYNNGGSLGGSSADFYWDDSNDRLGVGTNAPTTGFELYSTSQNPVITLTGADNSAYDPQIQFRTDGTPTVKFSTGVDAGDGDAFKIYSGEGIGGTDEFVIDTDGTVSIANLSVGSQYFETDAGILSWIDLPISDSAASGVAQSYSAAIDGTDLLTVYGEADGSGGVQNIGVGVNTDSPSYKFHVVSAADEAVAGFTDANGTCTINPTSSALSCASDERLKKDIVNIDSALDTVLGLRSVQFHWNGEEEDDELHYGFIAQEIEEVLPELVEESKDGFKSVSYSAFVPLLAHAIQEQNTLIEDKYTEIESILTEKGEKTVSEEEAWKESLSDQVLIIGDITLDLESRIGDVETSQEETTLSYESLKERIAGLEENIELLDPEQSVSFVAALEEEMEDIREANGALLDFFDVINPETLVYLDAEGNLNIEGTLSATALETQTLTISLFSEEENNTIGEAVIVAIEVDEDEDGKDDETEADGKSVFVEVENIKEDSKVFLTPKTAISSPLAVTEIQEDKGFSVKIPESVEEDLAFDWWIVHIQE